MPRVVAEHGCDHVEQVDEGYVLHCECGWRSPADPLAAVVGTAWDDHRTEAA